MLYDPTHDMPNVPEGMTFHKVGLGTGENRFTKHLDDEMGGKFDVLLKIDTEGAEYEYFMDENIQLLGSILHRNNPRNTSPERTHETVNNEEDS